MLVQPPSVRVCRAPGNLSTPKTNVCTRANKIAHSLPVRWDGIAIKIFCILARDGKHPEHPAARLRTGPEGPSLLTGHYLVFIPNSTHVHEPQSGQGARPRWQCCCRGNLSLHRHGRGLRMCDALSALHCIVEVIPLVISFLQIYMQGLRGCQNSGEVTLAPL